MLTLAHTAALPIYPASPPPHTPWYFRRSSVQQGPGHASALVIISFPRHGGGSAARRLQQRSGTPRIRTQRQHPAADGARRRQLVGGPRSEEHTSELQSLMRISYAVFCLKKQNTSHRSYHKPPQ